MISHNNNQIQLDGKIKYLSDSFHFIYFSMVTNLKVCLIRKYMFYIYLCMMYSSIVKFQSRVRYPLKVLLFHYHINLLFFRVIKQIKCYSVDTV